MSGKDTTEGIENAIRTKIWSYISEWLYWHTIESSRVLESLVKVRLRVVRASWVRIWSCDRVSGGIQWRVIEDMRVWLG